MLKAKTKNKNITAEDLGIDLKLAKEEELFKWRNRKDLEMRLQEFKGIGPVTTRIFLNSLKKPKIFGFSP